MKEYKAKDNVVLRNGRTAHIIGYGPTSKNVLIGIYIKNVFNSHHTRICWHSSGKWRWDDQESPLDIVNEKPWKCPINFEGCVTNCGNYGCGN